MTLAHFFLDFERVFHHLIVLIRSSFPSIFFAIKIIVFDQSHGGFTLLQIIHGLRFYHQPIKNLGIRQAVVLGNAHLDILLNF